MSKLSQLRQYMQAGEWCEAIKMAAAFPRLPLEYRNAILNGREAVLRPDFQRALKRDPGAQIKTAIAALRAAYGR